MIHQRKALIFSIAGTLIALTLFAWLAAALSSDSIRNLDAAVRLGIHQCASPTLTTLARGVTVLGSIKLIAVALAMVIAGFLLAGWRQSAIALTWTMAGAIVVENALKYAFHRDRPEAFFGTDLETYSFPSGHALLSACFYCVLAKVLAARTRSGYARAAIWTVAALLIAAIGLSRIYLGVHYPTDVLGGYLAAAFWLGAIASIGILRGVPKDDAQGARPTTSR